MQKQFYTLILTLFACLEAFGQQKMFSDQVRQNAIQTLDTLSKETGYSLQVQFTQLPLPIAEIDIDTANTKIADLLDGSFFKKLNEPDSAKAFFATQLQEVKEILEERVAQLPNQRNTIFINPHTGVYYYMRKKSANGKEIEELFQSQFIFGENIPQDLQNKINTFKPSKEIRYDETNRTTQNDIYLKELADFLRKTLRGEEPEVKQKFTFQELNYNNSIQVYEDDGSLFPTPHIKRKRRTDSPICYVKKSRIKASIKLTYKDPLDKEKVFLKASTNYNLAIPATKATVNETTKEISFSEVSFDADLPDKVDYLEKFEVTWQISVDGGTTWEEATKTKNTLYVVMTTPLKPTTLYETLLFIGCKYAKDKNNEPEVFEGIWQHFMGRNVKDKRGKEMSYYGVVSTQVTETKDLLNKKTGQCSSFAHLFLDVLYAQGIDSKVGAGEGNYVVFCTKDKMPLDDKFGFFVKNWSFGTTKSSGDTDYPYKNVPQAGKDSRGGISPTLPDNAGNYIWVETPEVTELQGVAGQNNPNPVCIFGNHQIVHYKGKFYDPSYGIMYENATHLSERAIDAFYKVSKVDKSEQEVDLDFNGDGVKTTIKEKYPVYFLKKNPFGLQIEITYYPY